LTFTEGFKQLCCAQLLGKKTLPAEGCLGALFGTGEVTAYSPGSRQPHAHGAALVGSCRVDPSLVIKAGTVAGPLLFSGEPQILEESLGPTTAAGNYCSPQASLIYTRDQPRG